MPKNQLFGNDIHFQKKPFVKMYSFECNINFSSGICELFSKNFDILS